MATLRAAIFSDVHGNFQALEAVVADIGKHGASQLICLGDLATLGPQPRETLDLVKSLDCLCISGNHDAVLLDIKNAAHLQIAPPVIKSVEWCLEKLEPDDLNFLKDLEDKYTLPAQSDTSVLCFHGSPRSNTDLILAGTDEQLLNEYLQGWDAQLFAGGHTHLQMLRRHGEKTVMNCGSVGAAFRKPAAEGGEPELLPAAEYALVEIGDKFFNVHFRQVAYDIDKYIAVLAGSDLPMAGWWISQYRKM